MKGKTNKEERSEKAKKEESWSLRGNLKGIPTIIHRTLGEHFRSMFAESSWSVRRMFKSLEFEHSANIRFCECSNIRRIFQILSEEFVLLPYKNGDVKNVEKMFTGGVFLTSTLRRN